MQWLLVSNVWCCTGSQKRIKSVKYELSILLAYIKLNAHGFGLL